MSLQRIDIQLKCLPPTVTAQTKRLSMVNGRPRFFHNPRLKREEITWGALLLPHQPKTPLDGPIALSLSLTYPHLSATPKRDRELVIPKVSRPDAGNVSKHLEDMLVRLRFIHDDQQVAKLTVEKFHGPESQVGIFITIRQMGHGR